MKCKMCGKEFEPVHKRHVYCHECGIERYVERYKERAKKRSIELRPLEERERNCIVCGKTFTAKSIGHKCCSKECRDINGKKNRNTWKEKNKKETQWYEVKCAICGRVFTTRRADGKYCNEKCRSIGANILSREINREKAEKKKSEKRRKSMVQNISDIQREADRMNMSYGKYVSMYCNK